MPLFFFDTHDGQRTMEDLYGIELPDQQEAYKVAIDTLPDLARNALPTPEPNSVGVRVRNEDGELVVEVSLVLVVRWGQDGHPVDRRAFPDRLGTR